MKYLYLSLDVGSLLVPLIFSFHPKIRFYKEWKYLFPALIPMLIIFLVWDVIFTENGVWGFNDKYLIGVDILNLPIEEWLFFLCIPYACLFTHYSLNKLVYKKGLSPILTKYLSYSIILFCLIISFKNIDREYTFYNLLLCAIIVGLVFIIKPKVLNTFYLSFLIILIPFFIVNGLLTGTLIPEEVVWYNNAENLGLRILTVPVEDIFYALSMLLIPQFLIEMMRKPIQQV